MIFIAWDAAATTNVAAAAATAAAVATMIMDWGSSRPAGGDVSGSGEDEAGQSEGKMKLVRVVWFGIRLYKSGKNIRGRHSWPAFHLIRIIQSNQRLLQRILKAASWKQYSFH